MLTLITFLIVIAVVAALVVYEAYSWGYVLWKFWYWFLLPIFPQLPHVTLIQSIYLAIFISLFKNHNVPDESNKTTKQKVSTIISHLLTPWITLIAAYIVYHWFFI